MKTYAQIQEQLNGLVGFPQNLPVLYQKWTPNFGQ